MKKISQPGFGTLSEPARVKVMPLSCHCKLKTLVPLLQQLLQKPVSSAEPKAKSTSSTSSIPLTLEFRFP